ncbi:MAG: hypothetical protein RXO36_06840 [Candidatus Nanopusillus acidilobi]
MSSLELLGVALGIGIAITIMMGILVAGWIISSIPIYFVAKHFNKNLSFEKVLGATILSEIVSFFIIAGSGLTISLFISNFGPHIFWEILEGLIIVTVIDFIAVLIIYKLAFKVGWGAAFVISILATIIESVFNLSLSDIFYTVAFLIPILGPATSIVFTVNTPVGTLGIRIDDIIGYFILGLILYEILGYLVTKFSKINISFLESLVVNMFSGAVSFIIIIISFLSFILEENIVAFFIGSVLAFILASIIYKDILNVSWKKAIPISIIASVLWSIIGLTTLPYCIYFMAC